MQIGLIKLDRSHSVRSILGTSDPFITYSINPAGLLNPRNSSAIGGFIDDSYTSLTLGVSGSFNQLPSIINTHASFYKGIEMYRATDGKVPKTTFIERFYCRIDGAQNPLIPYKFRQTEVTRSGWFVHNFISSYHVCSIANDIGIARTTPFCVGDPTVLNYGTYHEFSKNVESDFSGRLDAAMNNALTHNNISFRIVADIQDENKAIASIKPFANGLVESVLTDTVLILDEVPVHSNPITRHMDVSDDLSVSMHFVNDIAPRPNLFLQPPMFMEFTASEKVLFNPVDFPELIDCLNDLPFTDLKAHFVPTVLTVGDLQTPDYSLLYQYAFNRFTPSASIDEQIVKSFMYRIATSLETFRVHKYLTVPFAICSIMVVKQFNEECLVRLYNAKTSKVYLNIYFDLSLTPFSGKTICLVSDYPY